MNGLIAGVDLGKSRCRVAIAQPDGTIIVQADGNGAVGLADPSGGHDAATVVARVVKQAFVEGGVAADELGVVCIGAAGAFADSSSLPTLATELRGSLAVANVAVTSDAATAHAGALGGAPGVVTAIGTGAVTLAIAADGRSHQVDGWGQWLGDDGSGAWIGRAALRAVLREVDGRGPPTTTLSAAAVARFGALSGLPAALPFDANLPRTTAAFAPDVVSCAGGGDAVAIEILDEAVLHWVGATVAAADALDERTVACVGGLGSVDHLRVAWERQLPPGLVVAVAGGDSVSGALLLARRSDLPHEPLVYRDGP